MSDEQQSNLPEQRVKLAPSGITMHDYRVSISESGSVAIEWTGRKQFTLAFTPEEAYNLLAFLDAHREQIESGYHEWMNPASKKEHPF